MTAPRIIALAIVLGLAGLPARAQSQTAAEIMRAFDEAAMQINGKPAEETARWKAPIRMAFAPSMPTDARTLGKTVLFDLTIETGVAISDASIDNANYIIEPGDNVCQTRILWTDAGTIISVNVRVPPAQMRSPRCWHHEVLHSLGLRGHVKTPASVLSHAQGAAQEATALDRLMLRMLYRLAPMPDGSRSP